MHRYTLPCRRLLVGYLRVSVSLSLSRPLSFFCSLLPSEGVFGPALQRITETIKASWNSLDCLAQDPARCALLLESVTALCLYLDPTEETLEKTSLLQQSTEEADGDEAPDLGDTNALLLRTFFRRFLPSVSQ